MAPPTSSPRSGPLARLARLSYRRRRFVVLGWVGLVVGLSLLAAVAGGELRNDFSVPGAESQDATDLLEEGGLGASGGFTGQVVFRADDDVAAGIADPAVETAMEDFFTEVTTAVPEVGIVSPYEDGAGTQVAPDGRVAYAEIRFGELEQHDAYVLADEVAEVWADTDLPSDVQVELGGEMFFEEAEPSSEAIGFLAAMVILLVAFGSVLAMTFPLVTALFGISAGIAAVMLIANGIDIPEFGPAGVMLVAIGVGIDYALLIVARYRDELRAGRDPESAVVVAMSTAGRSVSFAGATVVVAIMGLMVAGIAVFQALAIAISAGVLMVMLATITLVPALLGFAGRNIDKLSVHRKGRVGAGATAGGNGVGSGNGSGPAAVGAHAAHGLETGTATRPSAWYRWSRLVQRRPVPITVGAVALLLLLAAPLGSMRLGFSDAGNRPDTDTARRAYDLLADGFGPGFNAPLFLAVDLPGDAAEDEAVLSALDRELADTDGVAVALPATVNAAGDTAVIQAFPETSPQEEATDDTVARLRDEVAPTAVADTSADVLVGGMPAAAVDYADSQSRQLPVFVVAVLVISFLLLMAVFRSVVVAAKAVVMNLLSIGAAYGAIVAIFQWGWFSDLLPVGEPGPIEAWAPMILFAITFGLSIDYEVFLISRIKEEHDRGSPTSTAVADGLAKTARLITAAAAIMVCVAGGFVLSPERGVQIFGLGLAVAILVDAALVRTLLVPAAMELLGDRNWWMPRWLDRLLPSLDIDGGPSADGATDPVRGGRPSDGAPPDDRTPELVS